VMGCERLSAYHEASGIERDAVLASVLREADLALLHVPELAHIAPLRTGARAPDLHEDLLVLGYELGTPTMGSKNLRVSFGSAVLQDMVPDAVRREIEAVG